MLPLDTALSAARPARDGRLAGCLHAPEKARFRRTIPRGKRPVSVMVDVLEFGGQERDERAKGVLSWLAPAPRPTDLCPEPRVGDPVMVKGRVVRRL